MLGHSAQTDTCCDTCGAEITTGMMAAYCERRERCEFWPADADAASVQLMRWMRGEVASPVLAALP